VTLESLNKEIADWEEQLEKLEQEFLDGKTDKFAGMAFISFNTEPEKDECIEKNQIGFWQRMR
jgi:hypothetical protein